MPEGFNQENRHQAILDFLKHERNQCIDDLPKERVIPGDPNYYKYKCRTAWWQGIKSNLSVLLEDGILDDQTKERVSSFLLWMSTVDFKKFRTRDDINKANDILDIVIGDLESRKK